MVDRTAVCSLGWEGRNGRAASAMVASEPGDWLKAAILRWVESTNDVTCEVRLVRSGCEGPEKVESV